MREIILDVEQKYLARKFLLIASNIKPNNFFSRFNHIFLKEDSYSGIYLHGSVGCGKTMLMRKFYDKVNTDKKIVHYQQFMQDIHRKIHYLQKTMTNELIAKLALDIANECVVLCIDEFEINDISDAMIISSLFKYLQKYGVFIFLTTNTAPDNLYKCIFQRRTILQFILLVQCGLCLLAENIL